MCGLVLLKCIYFAIAFRKEGEIYSMETIAKLKIGEAAVRQLFRAVIKATDEINEASFLHGQSKPRYKSDTLAQGSEFYVPNIQRQDRVQCQGIFRYQRLV